MAEMVYKFLYKDGKPCHGGHGAWPLPTEDGPGDWLRVEGDLVPCKNGLHVCREQDLIHWLAPALFEAEIRGERIVVDDTESKVVVREARLLRRVETWNVRTMRLFAYDCAERVLHISLAVGAATAEELAAARAATRAAANAAANAASWDVTRTLSATRAAAGAAAVATGWLAFRDACWDAAADWNACWDAARDAERAWQNDRLVQYIRGEAA